MDSTPLNGQPTTTLVEWRRKERIVMWLILVVIMVFIGMLLALTVAATITEVFLRQEINQLLSQQEYVTMDCVPDYVYSWACPKHQEIETLTCKVMTGECIDAAHMYSTGCQLMAPSMRRIQRGINKCAWCGTDNCIPTTPFFADEMQFPDETGPILCMVFLPMIVIALCVAGFEIWKKFVQNADRYNWAVYYMSRPNRLFLMRTSTAAEYTCDVEYNGDTDVDSWGLQVELGHNEMYLGDNKWRMPDLYSVEQLIARFESAELDKIIAEVTGDGLLGAIHKMQPSFAHLYLYAQEQPLILNDGYTYKHHNTQCAFNDDKENNVVIAHVFVKQ